MASQGANEPRQRIGRAIQGLVLLSVVLGALFLWQAISIVPSFVLEFVAIGWVLFIVDGALTFLRPRLSYALALVLALLALASSLPQSAHWGFVAGGDLLPASTFLAGSGVEVALLLLVVYYFLQNRMRKS